MNRIATTFTTFAASLAFAHIAGAADPTLESLNSRLSTIEARLITLEETIRGNSTPSYSYSNQATLEATNANAPMPPAAADAPTESTTYVIRDGDTLTSIAEKHGVARADLLKANRLGEGQPIYIGETLMIPGAAPAPAVAKTEEKSATADKPETAKKESVVVGETKPDNAGSKSHTVVKGDTLTALSKKYGTTVENLKSANGLRSDVLTLGQKLAIPSGETKTAKTETAPSTAGDTSYEYDNPLLRSDETYGYYTVRKGDNLYALARDFFSNMSELQRLNRLGSSTLIYPGDELIVPTGKYNAYHNNGDMAQR